MRFCFAFIWINPAHRYHHPHRFLFENFLFSIRVSIIEREFPQKIKYIRDSCSVGCPRERLTYSWSLWSVLSSVELQAVTMTQESLSRKWSSGTWLRFSAACDMCMTLLPSNSRQASVMRFLLFGSFKACHHLPYQIKLRFGRKDVLGVGITLVISFAEWQHRSCFLKRRILRRNDFSFVSTPAPPPAK